MKDINGVRIFEWDDLPIDIFGRHIIRLRAPYNSINKHTLELDNSSDSSENIFIMAATYKAGSRRGGSGEFSLPNLNTEEFAVTIQCSKTLIKKINLTHLYYISESRLTDKGDITINVRGCCLKNPLINKIHNRVLSHYSRFIDE